MPLAPDIYQALFERAMQVEIGIGVATNEQRLLAAQLGAHKKRTEPAFDEIMVFKPENGEVWLVKKATEL